MKKPPLRRRFKLWRNRMRFLAGIRRKGRFYQLLIPSQFKPLARTLRVVLPAASLVPSLIIFNSVLASFAVALSFYVALAILERTTFSYVIVVAAPMPDFVEEPEKWQGVFFGYAPGPPAKTPAVGMFFSDAIYGRHVHSLLLKWNCGNHTEVGHNIDVMVVWLTPTRYAFFCYPSHHHPHFEQFRLAAEAARPQDGVHVPLFATIIMGKVCDLTSRSYLPTFQEEYVPGTPFLFQCQAFAGGAGPVAIPGCEPLVLHHLRICRKDDLTDKDAVFGLVRYGPFGR